MKKLLLILFVLLSTIGTLKSQVVSPLQAGHYFPGVINVRDMAAPPPGLFVLLYNAYLWTDTYIDGDGNELKEIDLSKLDPRLPSMNVDLNIQAFSTTPVIAWASKFKILGGTYIPLIMLPGYTYSKAGIFGEMKIIDTTITSSKSGSIGGFSDIMVQPLGLAWSVPAFDFMFTYAFYAPTGRYETGADDNLGLGYWTHQFQGFGYYYPVADQSTALMLGLTYELNSSIIDSDVRPGSRLTLEYGISQYFTERFEFTVQGAVNWQVSDDTGKDTWWDPSVHDKKNTLLFSANYWAVKNQLYFALKYGFDFGLRERFKNNILCLNIIYVPNVLTGN